MTVMGVVSECPECIVKFIVRVIYIPLDIPYNLLLFKFYNKYIGMFFKSFKYAYKFKVMLSCSHKNTRFIYYIMHFFSHLHSILATYILFMKCIRPNCLSSNVVMSWVSSVIHLRSALQYIPKHIINLTTSDQSSSIKLANYPHYRLGIGHTHPSLI